MGTADHHLPVSIPVPVANISSCIVSAPRVRLLVTNGWGAVRASTV